MNGSLKDKVLSVANDLSAQRAEAAAAGRPPRGVLIVSDIRILREGLAEVLAHDSAFLIAGVVGGLEEALAAAASQPVEIILLDAALPEGTSAVARLRECSAGAQIIVFALSETADAVITWAEAGVCGYVPRSAALSEFVDFIDCILRGEQTCSKRIAAGLLRRIAAAPPNPRRQVAREPALMLTPREEEVVHCLDAGLSNKEIARRLNIGVATAKSHVHNVLGKLMLERRSQVARWMRGKPRDFAPAREIAPRLTKSREAGQRV
jgi:DNA-binding NarL/FixJ family response regulator